MKFLVFVGPGNTGKTTLIGKVAHHFNDNLGYKEYSEGKISKEDLPFGFPSIGKDFYIVLEKDGKYVLFYSLSDVQREINRLQKFLQLLKEKGINISLAVIGSRDASEKMYKYTVRELNLTNENSIEIPLGRMVRGCNRNAGVEHYQQTILDLVTKRILPSVIENL